MKKISIIMPVYNVEEYLRQSVPSLLKQSYENLEIILIDDGSKDSSGKICDLLAAQDKRIVVRHQENAGPGAARNLALDIATGDYVMFCDSDDEYTPDMCLKMISAMGNGEVDFAICECEFLTDGEERKGIEEYMSLPKGDFVRKCAYKGPLKGGLLALNLVLWNKIFKRDLLEKYHIRFPGTRYSEDITFYEQYAMISRKAALVHEKLYRYRLRGSSLMGSLNATKSLDSNSSVATWDSLLSFVKKFDLIEEYKEYLFYDLVNRYCWAAFYSSDKGKSIRDSILKRLKELDCRELMVYTGGKMMEVLKRTSEFSLKLKIMSCLMKARFTPRGKHHDKLFRKAVKYRRILRSMLTERSQYE